MSGWRFGSSFALAWVSLYTLGLERGLRERRRLQVQSDLWEERASLLDVKATRRSIELRLLERTLRGVFDDIWWRMALEEEHMAMKIGAGVMMLVLLMVDWLEFHDLFESRTVTEYLVGVVSVPMLMLLFLLATGMARLTTEHR